MLIKYALLIIVAVLFVAILYDIFKRYMANRSKQDLPMTPPEEGQIPPGSQDETPHKKE